MLRSLTLAVAACALAACAHGPVTRKVLQPPTYDLHAYQAVGLLAFTSDRPPLGQVATDQFLSQLQQAQPGIRVVELGPQAQVLAQVGKSQLDVDAIRAIGERYHVQALFAGNLDASDAQTAVSITSLTSVGVHAKVHSQLGARLYDTSNAATIWSGAQPEEEEAGSMHLGRHAVGVAAEGTDSAYLHMIQRATFAVTDGFRAHWIRVKVDPPPEE